MSSSTSPEHVCGGAPAREPPCAPSGEILVSERSCPGSRCVAILPTSSAAILRPIASRPAPAAARSELQQRTDSSFMGAPVRARLCAPCPRVDLISNTSFSGHLMRFCAGKLPLSPLADFSLRWADAAASSAPFAETPMLLRVLQGDLRSARRACGLQPRISCHDHACIPAAISGDAISVEISDAQASDVASSQSRHAMRSQQITASPAFAAKLLSRGTREHRA